eukprot:gnl/Carplike_NY0171/905_a1243_882.p1 GENE.gnl/Carplike_NY0171/905_a1243_882~~gnl/Carplike_NY0171/905_a1243_882.p1  ORF type:complete len:1003 (-),score=360.05 gnl/Carplike_NY0171/905_a1243_882:93-3101(-)
MSLTTKEVKKLARPEFEANPEKFYPVEVFKTFGFHRHQCPKCGHFYWRHSEKQDTCGDSSCVGKYKFIGRGTGIGRGEGAKKISIPDAWGTFKEAFEGARIPHTAIKRYPVVARWRNDVPYVAAGIFCFQPFCVTGEVPPPANPLICPQFCLRFNDLDSIGLSGRHYSGFNMLGIQVFNTKDKFVYFKEECVEFNLNWLINYLKIDPDEITLIEDVWAGGGNLGPCVEYFINGLEVGNMVFMQFRVGPDGSRTPLDVQVIDVGIGLERIPWLINGSVTSYVDAFPTALKYFTDRVDGIECVNEMWQRFGEASCLLNIDEVDDIDETWKHVASVIAEKESLETGKEVTIDVKELRDSIEPVRDMYVILDHLRSLCVAITDGSLPSNVGGGSNLRSILRRSFAILHRRGWFEAIGGVDGVIELMKCHFIDLEKLHGSMTINESLPAIIALEYDRYHKSEAESRSKLLRMCKKRKDGVLTLEDWITIITSWGIDAETVSSLTAQKVPDMLFREISEREERSAKPPPTQLWETTTMVPTEKIYETVQSQFEWESKIVAIFEDVREVKKADGKKDGKKGKKGEEVEKESTPISKPSLWSLIALESSCVYPTSGGQQHDNATLVIDGEIYNVIDAFNVGSVVFHKLDKPLKALSSAECDPSSVIGIPVKGKIDAARRLQLAQHHSAAHLVSRASKDVLGPHIWQQGAKKDEDIAHLDITHFKGLTFEEEQQIERRVNQLIRQSLSITKTNMRKENAEKAYGFTLYQGGVVPGSTVRVVNVGDGIDVEACCGTHLDNTSEIGYVRIVNSHRVSDGVVRIHFKAGEAALRFTANQSHVLESLKKDWTVEESEIVKTASKFFSGYKRMTKEIGDLTDELLKLRMSLVQEAPVDKGIRVYETSEDKPTLYISTLPSYAPMLKEKNTAVCFIGLNFMYILGVEEAVDLTEIERVVSEATAETGEKKRKVVIANKKIALKGKGKKKGEKIEGMVEVKAFGLSEKQVEAIRKHLM